MKDLFKSKKFKAAVAGVLTALAGGLTGSLDWQKVVMTVVGVLVAYIAAQGVADFGKEKAKVEKGK